MNPGGDRVSEAGSSGDRTAAICGATALLLLVVAVPGRTWPLAVAAALPAALAVRALLIGVSIRDETVTVRNLLATKRFPVEAVADLVIESRNVRSRPQARLRLTSGFEVALDSMTAGNDETSRRELHEEVSRLRECLHR